MISFEESLDDIPGLSKYEEGKMPAWLKKQVLYFYGAGIKQPMTDAEFIDRFIRDRWLGHWGIAIVHGKEVAIFEHLGNDPYEVEEAAGIAESINCGFVLVEPSETYDGGCTTYLTEHIYVVPRLNVGDAAA